jgi:hypothetical protein
MFDQPRTFTNLDEIVFHGFIQATILLRLLVTFFSHFQRNLFLKVDYYDALAFIVCIFLCLIPSALELLFLATPVYWILNLVPYAKGRI